MSTSTNATSSVPVVKTTGKAGTTKPATPVQSTQNVSSEPKSPVKGKEPLYAKEALQQYKVAKLRLKEKGVLLYDPSHPELVLDTDSKEGKALPLTPFFNSRIGSVVELV